MALATEYQQAMAFASSFGAYPLIRYMAYTITLGSGIWSFKFRYRSVPAAPFNNFTYVYAQQLGNMHYAAL